MKKNEHSLRDRWDTINNTKTHILGVPGGRERKKGAERISEEITTEKFLNLMKTLICTPSKLNKLQVG